MEGTAIGILANGWKALEALSVADELRKINPTCLKYKYPQTLNLIIMCFSAQWRTADGTVLTKFSMAEAQGENEMRGVIRGKLLTTFAEALPPETILFDHGLKSIDLSLPSKLH